jgi:DNA modification methylase
MGYKEFLKQKEKTHISSGFQIDESELNQMLFDFQKHIVQTALRIGRFAIFAECGLGKTPMQLEWGHQVEKKEKKPVLFLAPLAVVEQTIDQASFFGYKINRLTDESPDNGLWITNFDQLKNVDVSLFCGVVLDESSILKGKDGKMSSDLINRCQSIPYRLACSATPSPNDHMELGQHSQFLGAMSYNEMLAMFFVHDGGETSKWRLRKHAEDNFWKFVCTWSISVDSPETLGFDGSKYNLPDINYIEHFIPVEKPEDRLFADVSISATDIHGDFKKTANERMKVVADMVNNSDEQWIVWGLSNSECSDIAKMINGAINVQGSDKPEVKAKNLNGFARNEFKCLVTKTSIASFGMNYQNAFNMAFLAYDFKFEGFYQGVRREYRFGQHMAVNVHLMIPESQMNVKAGIEKKQKEHVERISQMAKYSANTDYKVAGMKNATVSENEIIESDYHLICGDCVEETKRLPDNAADIVVFSPPFADLYVYSDKKEDMGNVSDYQQFEDHFKFLIPELKRVLKPGRICAIHCMDLPVQKGKEGYIGLRDFSGMLIKWFQDEGFIYHARTTIWKNPVTEMQRTKALGLLHKQIKKDSTMSRVGIPDYVLFFRNEGDNEVPITHQDKDPSKPDYLPVDLWQKYASPVWMDVDYSRTLNYRAARDNNDEKHICPLQLDTIERILHLYSNHGEVVLSPFGGIGSEGVQSLSMGRKSISIELKESYFLQNASNHRAEIAKRAQKTLF